MSITGELYRISPGRLDELLKDPAQVQEELYSDNHPENVDRRGCSVEKAWNAIEFMLERLAEAGRVPWVFPLTGGTETGAKLHYGEVWYRSTAEVKHIAEVLSGITQADLRSVFLLPEMSEECVYPQFREDEDPDELFDYVWQWYQAMVGFYQAAAEANEALLLHLA